MQSRNLLSLFYISSWRLIVFLLCPEGFDRSECYRQHWSAPRCQRPQPLSELPRAPRSPRGCCPGLPPYALWCWREQILFVNVSYSRREWILWVSVSYSRREWILFVSVSYSRREWILFVSCFMAVQAFRRMPCDADVSGFCFSVCLIADVSGFCLSLVLWLFRPSVICPSCDADVSGFCLSVCLIADVTGFCLSVVLWPFRPSIIHMPCDADVSGFCLSVVL